MRKMIYRYAREAGFSRQEAMQLRDMFFDDAMTVIFVFAFVGVKPTLCEIRQRGD